MGFLEDCPGACLDKLMLSPFILFKWSSILSLESTTEELSYVLLWPVGPLLQPNVARIEFWYREKSFCSKG